MGDEVTVIEVASREPGLLEKREVRIEFDSNCLLCKYRNSSQTA